MQLCRFEMPFEILFAVTMRFYLEQKKNMNKFHTEKYSKGSYHLKCRESLHTSRRLFTSGADNDKSSEGLNILFITYQYILYILHLP